MVKHIIKNLGIHVDSLIMYEYRGRKIRKAGRDSWGSKKPWRTYDKMEPVLSADTRRELVKKIDESLNDSRLSA